jgi:hypothetical protein
MEARATRTEGSPQTVEAIRSRLSDGTQKWRESASILCEVRRDVAHFLALKRAGDMHLRRAGRKRRLDCSESRSQAERLHAVTKGIPFDELRRIFIKVDHLMNLPIAKDRAAAACMQLPCVDAAPCRGCGKPLPQGRKKFCSEACRKTSSGRPELPPKEPLEFEAPFAPGIGADGDDREPNPLPGLGDRHLDCEFYEACLDLAILEEWESFRCDACDLKGPQEQLALGTFEAM